MTKWENRYNNHEIRLAKGAIRLNVDWTCGGGEYGYRVSVNDRALEDTVPDLDAARAKALQLARKILGEASADLAAIEREASK